MPRLSARPVVRPTARPRLRLLAPVVPVAFVQVVGSVAAQARAASGWSGWGPSRVSGATSAAAPLDAVAVALLLAGPLALLARWRAPLLAQGVAAAAVVGWSLTDRAAGPVWLSLAVATLSAVSRAGTPRRLAGYGVLAFAWVLVAVVVPAARGGLPPSQVLVGSLAWLLVLVAVAEAVRVRRNAAVDRRRTREQAALAEAEERRRRASDERLAVARELHDVIGHSLSMISVQSGVALELMDARPEVAREALTAIRAASRDALVEVHGVLASLRGDDGGDGAPPRAPAPTAADPDALVARARAAGLVVTTRAEGDLSGLPVAVDLAAARIVQEALTNVARHAGGAPAHVLLRRDPGALVVRVDDDGPAAGPATAGGGNGLPGMRERAAALGGTLVAVPRPAGGWRVEAHLPLVQDGQEVLP